MPNVDRILETALYCDDLDRAHVFYEKLFGFPCMLANERLRALDVNGKSVLLLFRRGATVQPLTLSVGLIPAHDGHGPAHFALAISNEDYEAWIGRLRDAGIAIESEARWEAGGRSVYFRDPDGHSVELATPGIWASY